MQKISGIIWDLDNSLYPFDEAFFQATKKALAKSILELGIDMTEEEAFKYAKASYPMDTIKKLHADFAVSIDAVFDSYYNNLDVDFLKKTKGFVEKLKKTDKKIAVISHANRSWAIRALDKLGLLEIIDDNLIMTAEDFNGQDKHKSTYAYSEMLARMELSASQVVMVDDKAENLKYAKFRGLKTALITYGQDKKDDNLKYVDKICLTPNCVLREFNNKAKKSKNKSASHIRSYRR